MFLCMISVMLPRAAVSAERVDEVLKSETKIHDPKDPKTLPKNGKGEVAFEHVSFHYPGAEEDVLHDIHLPQNREKRQHLSEVPDVVNLHWST